MDKRHDITPNLYFRKQIIFHERKWIALSVVSISGPQLFFFFLIERSNEIYYPTAQSREQIMRVQISRDIVQLFRQLIISHRKKTCLTSWLHLPSLVPYLTTVPCLLVKSLQLLKYRQRLIQSVVALWSSRMMKMKCSFGNYFHMQRAHPCL